MERSCSEGNPEMDGQFRNGEKGFLFGLGVSFLDRDVDLWAG